MNTVIAHSTSNIQKLSKLYEEVVFNKTKGGFDYQDEPLGKGQSEFLEIILSLSKSFSKEKIINSKLDEKIVNKFAEYHAIEKDSDFKIRVPDFYGMENIISFLKDKMDQKLDGNFGKEIAQKLQNKENKKESADETNSLNNLTKLCSIFVVVLNKLRNNLKSIKDYHLFAKNYYLIVLKILDQFINSEDTEDPVAKCSTNLISEFLNHFGKIESLLHDIWQIFKDHPKTLSIFYKLLDNFLKEKTRRIDSVKLLSLYDPKNAQKNFPQMTSFLITESKAETIKCIQNYIDVSSKQPTPAKGHRVLGDKWLLLVLNSLQPSTEKHWIQDPTERIFFARYISGKLLKKSKYNFDGSLGLIKSCLELATCDRLTSEYFELDMKGNQAETLAPMFFKNYLDLQMLDTGSRDNLMSICLDNRKKVRRFNTDNLSDVIKEKCFWRMEEIELWSLAVEKSYLRGCLDYLQMEEVFNKFSDKSQHVETLENCIWWLRKSFNNKENMQRYIEHTQEKNSNSANMEKRLELGTFDDMRFLNLDLNIDGNDYGLFSDRSFLKLNIRLWQVVVLAVRDKMWTKVVSSRKENSQSGQTVNKKKKNKNKKKKGKKENQEVVVYESAISKKIDLKIKEEEELLSKIDQSELVKEINHLASKINEEKYDFDYFCLRAKIFKNNFTKWKENAQKTTSFRINDNFKLLFKFVSAALSIIFKIETNEVSIG